MTIWLGVVLVALGLNTAPNGLSSELFTADPWELGPLVFFMAGVALVLTGIVGYGVKLGIEASQRGDR